MGKSREPGRENKLVQRSTSSAVSHIRRWGRTGLRTARWVRPWQALREEKDYRLPRLLTVLSVLRGIMLLVKVVAVLCSLSPDGPGQQ